MCLVLSAPYLDSVKWVFTCRRYALYVNPLQLKQISLVDKRLREISLPLLFRRKRFHLTYIKDVWKLATDAIESMLASTAFDVVLRYTRWGCH